MTQLESVSKIANDFVGKMTKMELYSKLWKFNLSNKREDFVESHDFPYSERRLLINEERQKMCVRSVYRSRDLKLYIAGWYS